MTYAHMFVRMIFARDNRQFYEWVEIRWKLHTTNQCLSIHNFILFTTREKPELVNKDVRRRVIEARTR